MKMRKIMNRKSYIVAVLMLLMPLMAGAQALKGSYFMDNSINRNKLNPALAPNRSYFMIPGVGNFNFGLQSNLEMQTFLYPAGDQIYTFLNQNVSVKDFNRALPKYPHLDISTDLNLLNFGFYTGKMFWTFDTGLRFNADVDVPRDLFTFMKQGTTMTGGDFNIGALSVNAMAYAHASLGFSREFFIPGLRLGAKVRGLVPLAYAGANFNDVRLTASPEKWTLTTNATLHTAVNGLTMTDAEGNISPNYDISSIGPAGFGFSVDLGAEYTLEFDGFINGVSVSAAVTDLGMIRYKAEAVQGFASSGSMDWTGVALSLEEGAFDKVTEDLANEAKKLLEVEQIQSTGALTKSSLPSFYVGAEMPFLNNSMSVGVLWSARKSFRYMRNELTLSYNLNPCKWFALGINYSFLNVGKTLGWMLELTPKYGPCLFLGSDYTFVEFAKMPSNMGVSILPTSMRANFHFGLAFAIGGPKKDRDE